MPSTKNKSKAKPAQRLRVPANAYALVAAFNTNMDNAVAGVRALAALQDKDTNAAMLNLLRRTRAQVTRDCLLTLAEHETVNAGRYDRRVIADERQR